MLLFHLESSTKSLVKSSAIRTRRLAPPTPTKRTPLATIRRCA